MTSPPWLERLGIARARRRAVPVERPVGATRGRLLVDVTTIARRDVGTGIQRVVRSIAAQMRAHPRGWRIAPIRYEKRAFRHALGPDRDEVVGGAVVPGPDDVFLGLDLSFDTIRRETRRLLRYKRAGTRFWFVVYDLLPLGAPAYFSDKVAVRFRWWLIATAKLADGYLCISPHVAAELRALLAGRYGLRDEISIEVIPMGFDIGSTKTPSADTSVAADPARATVLAVGTLEPRKGYGILLDAFERLWSDDADVTLVIVGARGWKTEALQRRIVEHREFGRRLVWLSALDDTGLVALYGRAHLLVAASYAEGFGLPVIEAVSHACPVLARDIPAFRAHAAYGLRYFPPDADATELAASLTAVLADSAQIRSDIAAVRLPSWFDAAARVQSLVSRDRAALPPGVDDRTDAGLVIPSRRPE